MINIQHEISQNIPKDIPSRYLSGGIPILTAYGCALLERDTGKSFVYTAVNLISGKTETLSRRINPLSTNGVELIVDKMRLSSVAGAGRLEADRPFGERITFEKCREILIILFKKILPTYGYAIRREQIALAEHILEAIYRRRISLAEAEVGTGKTLAYLVPAIIAKRGRLNDFWNTSFYPGTPFAKTAQMPIVVATSSIALQKAILTDYIPELSDIMLSHGIIKTPLTAVIRKGREHYVCERNLRAHIQFEQDSKMKLILKQLLKPNANIDLAEIDAESPSERLTAHVKRKIAVPSRCYENCRYRNSCAYLHFRKQAESPEIDIQVCNHNYLLADTMRRKDKQPPLIPNYQSIIIDEAHKLLQAARSMYGTEFSNQIPIDLKDGVDELNFKYKDAQKIICKDMKKLHDESNRLFRILLENARSEDTDDEHDRSTAEINTDAARHLQNIRNISDSLIERISSEPVIGNGNGRKSQVLWELTKTRNQAAALVKHSELICWLETGDIENRLCAIPKDLDKRLFNDQWKKGIPTILTSGTLSAGAGTSCAAGASCADFSHTKRTLGLERPGIRLSETSKPSPFDYRKNSLLYISENVTFPDQRDKAYITAVANEIEQLILASHGHAAILFTSYNMMGIVYANLKKRELPFPMFRLEKGGIREIESFKKSGNGVLFASGALWEGIDIPGDILSLLIIVKLPFAVPDPIGEYEKSLYNDMAEYKAQVLLPEMLIKLKQGFGRLIRTMNDTGVVAILDCRASEKGAYRGSVIRALPNCWITNRIADVTGFILMCKTFEYFN